jgi:hypothetical protein
MQHETCKAKKKTGATILLFGILPETAILFFRPKPELNGSCEVKDCHIPWRRQDFKSWGTQLCICLKLSLLFQYSKNSTKFHFSPYICD